MGVRLSVLSAASQADCVWLLICAELAVATARRRLLIGRQAGSASGAPAVLKKRNKTKQDKTGCDR